MRIACGSALPWQRLRCILLQFLAAARTRIGRRVGWAWDGGRLSIILIGHLCAGDSRGVRPMRLGFQHTYGALPGRFYAQVAPTPVQNPQLVVFNRPLAAELGLDASTLEPQAAAVFSGNQLPEDANPLAMGYAGHQFGVFVPRLGDGRAILLGEIKDRAGVLRDLQLKGAGLTPFSRGGDGRAVIGPMLREYLISEAMYALGVPTTRSLAVVTTGETVYREAPQPGAVLTRVANSHVRVGTFQYFAARGDQDGLRALLDYVIARHYPAARQADSPALAVLKAVMERQISLVAQWMLLGFIHGVMNTDNMAISGETIDYGPCAFMDHYDPKTVFSSIDSHGRYAYTNQPAIAHWNLARFAEALLPLIDADRERAIGLAREVLDGFMEHFDARILAGMCRKIGLAAPLEGDAALVRALLSAMEHCQADFTLTFRRLARAAENPGDAAELRELFSPTLEVDAWLHDWQQRLERDSQSPAERARSMRGANPAFIPRNHRVEFALEAAERGDYGPFHRLLSVLSHPYEEQPDMAELARPPQPSERVLQTFCGT
jgi:serine/tyrosine/threonine adenylyltransferase